MKPLVFDNSLRHAIATEAIRCYPFEACGFLLGHIGQTRQALEFVACRNKQDELHQADPARYPRTATTAYAIDPMEQAGIEKYAQEQGLTIVAILHSHPDHDAYFSAEDKGNAAPWGEPLFPDVSYVVVSVFAGAVREMNDFFWDDIAQDFCKRTL